MRETPAQMHDRLVDLGANRFVDTYLRLMKDQSAGGRLPGVKIPTKQELLDFYRNETTPEYWQNLAVQDPAEAETQLSQWQKTEAT